MESSLRHPPSPVWGGGGGSLSANTSKLDWATQQGIVSLLKSVYFKQPYYFSRFKIVLHFYSLEPQVRKAALLLLVFSETILTTQGMK